MPRHKPRAVDPHALTDAEIIIIGGVLDRVKAILEGKERRVVEQFVACADGIVAARDVGGR